MKITVTNREYHEVFKSISTVVRVLPGYYETRDGNHSCLLTATDNGDECIAVVTGAFAPGRADLDFQALPRSAGGPAFMLHPWISDEFEGAMSIGSWFQDKFLHTFYVEEDGKTERTRCRPTVLETKIWRHNTREIYISVNTKLGDTGLQVKYFLRFFSGQSLINGAMRIAYVERGTDVPLSKNFNAIAISSEEPTSILHGEEYGIPPEFVANGEFYRVISGKSEFVEGSAKFIRFEQQCLPQFVAETYMALARPNTPEYAEFNRAEAALGARVYCVATDDTPIAFPVNKRPNLGGGVPTERTEISAIIKRRGLWRDQPVGFNSNGAAAGFHRDFSWLMGIELMNRYPDAIEYYWAGVVEDYSRPYCLLEEDGSKVSLANHTGWKTFGERTDMRFSRDSLGKAQEGRARPPMGPIDYQHCTHRALLTAYRYTHDPAIFDLIEHLGNIYEASVDYVKGARGIGRELLFLSEAYQVTRIDTFKVVLLRRLDALKNSDGFAATLDNAAPGRQSPIQQVNLREGVLDKHGEPTNMVWVPWEEAEAIKGLAAAHKVVNDSTLEHWIRTVVKLAVHNIVRNGIFRGVDGSFHLGYRIPFNDGETLLPSQVYVGSPYFDVGDGMWLWVLGSLGYAREHLDLDESVAEDLDIILSEMVNQHTDIINVENVGILANFAQVETRQVV